jgi:hypothetical protein
VWSQQAYLKASNTEKLDGFGCDVAVSGGTILVGAFGESSNATGVNGDEGDNSYHRAGAAYVFSTPIRAIGNVIAILDSMGLSPPVANSLSAPLKSIDPDNVVATCGKLVAFINQVDAKGKNSQLTPTQAGQLLKAANVIKAGLGCPL